MAETSATITSSGSTGGTCQRTGPYRPSRHGDIIVFFQRGQVFTLDPADARTTSWSLVNAIPTGPVTVTQ
jgi:hypothetical protein